MPWCTRRSATTSRRLPPRSDAPASRCFRPRSPAATAISNSSSARAVVERLVVDHVGHRGGGVAIAGGRTVLVRYTPGRGLAGEHASAERITPFCPHFTVCGGCAIQHWQAERYQAWKRDIVLETL